MKKPLTKREHMKGFKEAFTAVIIAAAHDPKYPMILRYDSGEYSITSDHGVCQVIRKLGLAKRIPEDVKKVYGYGLNKLQQMNRQLRKPTAQIPRMFDAHERRMAKCKSLQWNFGAYGRQVVDFLDDPEDKRVVEKYLGYIARKLEKEL